jgi:hypothetical protein
MQHLIHVQSAAIWYSTSHRAAMPSAPFAFGRMTTSCWDFRSWQAARTASVFTRRSGSSYATAHLSIGSRVTFDDQQTLTGVTHSGDPSTQLVTRTCFGIQKLTVSFGVHPALMRVYITGEMIIGCHNRKWANHALQRTRRGRRGCNRGVPCAGSLSLGRSAIKYHGYAKF